MMLVAVATAQISMTDSYGDGWVGGVDGYYNLWELYDESDGSLRTRGTLADNHDRCAFNKKRQCSSNTE